MSLDAESMKTCKENDLKIFSRMAPCRHWLNENASHWFGENISLNLYVRIVRILRVWEGLEPSLYIEF